LLALPKPRRDRNNQQHKFEFIYFLSQTKQRQYKQQRNCKKKEKKTWSEFLSSVARLATVNQKNADSSMEFSNFIAD